MSAPEQPFKHYQVIREGNSVPITELSREELMFHLAISMDLLEELDEIQLNLGDIIKRYRR